MKSKSERIIELLDKGLAQKECDSDRHKISRRIADYICDRISQIIRIERTKTKSCKGSGRKNKNGRKCNWKDS